MKRVVTFLGLFLIGASANGANGQKTDGIAIPDWSRGNAIPNSPVKSTTPKKTTANTQASSVQKTTLDAKLEAATKIQSTKIDNFTAYSNGVAVDNNTGLMWMRCSLGQTWNGKTCIGNALKYKWNNINGIISNLNNMGYIGHNGWRLPNINELAGIRYCSSGFDRPIVQSITTWCYGNTYQKPTINVEIFPKTALGSYWTSSTMGPHKANVWDENDLWGVDFVDGNMHGNDRNNYHLHIRLVREVY